MTRIAKFKQWLRRLSWRLILVIAPSKSAHVVSKMQVKHLESNDFRFRISNDKMHIDTRFDIGEDKDLKVTYQIDKSKSVFETRSIFYALKEEEYERAFALIAHLNNLFKFGKVMIDFNSKSVYYENAIGLSDLLVFPDYLQSVNMAAYYTPLDLIWCFNKVMAENEEPVVVIGEFLRLKNVK